MSSRGHHRSLPSSIASTGRNLNQTRARKWLGESNHHHTSKTSPPELCPPGGLGKVATPLGRLREDAVTPLSQVSRHHLKRFVTSHSPSARVLSTTAMMSDRSNSRRGTHVGCHLLLTLCPSGEGAS